MPTGLSGTRGTEALAAIGKKTQFNYEVQDTEENQGCGEKVTHRRSKVQPDERGRAPYIRIGRVGKKVNIN